VKSGRCQLELTSRITATRGWKTELLVVLVIASLAGTPEVGGDIGDVPGLRLGEIGGTGGGGGDEDDRRGIDNGAGSREECRDWRILLEEEKAGGWGKDS
jgi:hypothetical protein